MPTVNDGCQKLSGQNITEIAYCAQLCRKSPPAAAVDGMWGDAVFTNTPIRMYIATTRPFRLKRARTYLTRLRINADGRHHDATRRYVPADVG